MKPTDAAKIIITAIVAHSPNTGIYVPVDDLADRLIDDGMDLDDIESGLTEGFENGWLDLSERYITVTQRGEALLRNSTGHFHCTIH